MDNIFSVVSRLKNTSDGADFLSYLTELSKKNYVEWKVTNGEVSDVLKGKALAYDYLITVFEICEDKLSSSSEKPKEWI